jgi:hypothetical protein
MHRAMGLVLAALGVLLIVGAVLVRTVVSGQVVKYPLSENLSSALRGHGGLLLQPQPDQARDGRDRPGHLHGGRGSVRRRLVDGGVEHGHVPV